MYYGGAIAALLLCVAVLYQLYIQYRKKYVTEAVITYFATSLFGKNTLDDILWDVAKNCIHHLNFEDCVIYLLDEERQVLVQKAAFGPKNPERFEIKHPIEIPLGEGITGTVALTGKPEIITDTRRDPRYIMDDMFRLSELTVPIFYESKVIGIIDSEHRRRGFFTEAHLLMLEKIAAICAIKIGKTLAEERAQQREQEMRQLRQQLAEFRLATLKSQMNPHFMFNCLNGIYNCIISAETEKAQEYVTSFARLLRMALLHAEKNFIPLEEEIAVTNHYLKIEALRTDNAFEYGITVDEQVDTSMYQVPAMLIQPFLENAIWHGLMNKKTGSRYLQICWRMHGEHELLCEITDNGIGRRQAAMLQKSGLKSDLHQSKGMQLCYERVELYKSLFNTQCSIMVSDLLGDDGQPDGTRVNITFEARMNNVRMDDVRLYE